MNGMQSLSPAIFNFHNCLFFSLHCQLFSLCIFSKNSYLFIGYRYCVLKKRTKNVSKRTFWMPPIEETVRVFKRGKMKD